MYLYGFSLNLGVKLWLTDMEVGTAQKGQVYKINKKLNTTKSAQPMFICLLIYLAMNKEDGHDGRL